MLTTTAPVHDAQVTDTIHKGLAERDLLPAEHFVDAGYAEPVSSSPPNAIKTVSYVVRRTSRL